MHASPVLTRTSTLWWLFAATVVITELFPILAGVFDLTLIDGISSPEAARQVIAAFSADQRVAHAWITATLDVVYPLAYGLFFAASTVRFFPSAGRYLAWLPLLAIPVDLLEGMVQVLALTGVVDWLAIKAFVTPLKTLLFFSGLVTTVAGWLKWGYLRITGARS